ncbi:hypothetical protein JVU11DRAFT_4325 [Chiua virens]|nr:hypothetical protein JVU11DRAFT_4325 [Chiua virens]
MQFILAMIIASASRLATQFGVVTISPTTVTPGEILTVNSDFSCAINTFGHHPEFTDYYIEVPTNNNGHEPPILLYRGTLQSGTSDSFTVTVPAAYYTANASYAVVLDTTYAVNGPSGQLYSVVGGVETPITINVS